jgi:hypothetical protein
MAVGHQTREPTLAPHFIFYIQNFYIEILHLEVYHLSRMTPESVLDLLHQDEDSLWVKGCLPW